MKNKSLPTIIGAAVVISRCSNFLYAGGDKTAKKSQADSSSAYSYSNSQLVKPNCNGLCYWWNF